MTVSGSKYRHEYKYPVTNAQIKIIISVTVTLMIFILDRLPVAKAPMILVINSTDISGENDIMSVVDRYAKYANVKSRNMTASLLTHDGEVTF